MPKSKRRLNADDVERRLRFLISEAQQPSPIYDQVVRYALRVVSNFYCIGRDGGSNDVYHASRHRSVAAHRLIEANSYKSKLICEHQESLKRVWNWIVANANTIHPSQIEERMKKWPMVVITREENARLKDIEDPLERYKEIEVLYRNDNDDWISRKQNQRLGGARSAKG